MIRNLCLVAAAVLLFAAPPAASAYWPYFGYGGGFGYGPGWGYNMTSNYVPAPPYYSIYPPVYYSSQITARHYGASPFAWYPGTQPITYVPQAEPTSAPDPVMIENPYVAGAKTTSKAAPAAKATNRPAKIANPFVAQISR